MTDVVLVYLLFLNTISTPCLIVLVIALLFLLVSEECRLTKNSSLFLSSLFFSAVVEVGSLGMVSLSLGGDSAFSVNRGVSMVLAVVISVEKSIVSRSGGCAVIVGVIYYLGIYLLVS